PDLMAIIVVEDDAFAGLPADGLVVHAHPAVLALLRNDEAEMGTQQALAHAAMARDVVARRQDGEQGCLQAGNRAQHSRCLRAARAVALARHPEAEQDEHLPLVAARDVTLVWRDLVEGRQPGAIL